MAEVTAPEPVDPNTVDMDVETVEANQKRLREEEEGEAQEDKDDVVSKKQKLDDEKSVEEQRLENLEEEEPQQEQNEKEEEKEPVKLGPKSFVSSLEMFNYFYNFLHLWPQYLNVNKYEHMMLLELLKNGHAEPAKKIGGGIRAFQIRKHPTFKSRCFFLIREDDSVDDFSFRKCVDHILPLPEEMHLKSEGNKALGGGGGGGGGKHHGGKGGRGRGGSGGGRGRGRGGRWRH